MAENRLQSEDGRQAVEVLYGEDALVMGWHMAHFCQEGTPDNYHAVGITLGGILIASVIYSRYRHPDVEIHIMSTDKRWCTRRTLRHIFNYPFIQLECNRVTAHTDPAVPAVCNFLQRIGFVKEGLIREGSADGDVLLLGMLRRECRWIN